MEPRRALPRLDTRRGVHEAAPGGRTWSEQIDVALAAQIYPAARSTVRSYRRHAGALSMVHESAERTPSDLACLLLSSAVVGADGYRPFLQPHSKRCAHDLSPCRVGARR